MNCQKLARVTIGNDSPRRNGVKRMHISEECFKLCRTSLLQCDLICFLRQLQICQEVRIQGREEPWWALISRKKFQADVRTRYYGTAAVSKRIYVRLLSFIITNTVYGAKMMWPECEGKSTWGENESWFWGRRGRCATCTWGNGNETVSLILFLRMHRGKSEFS